MIAVGLLSMSIGLLSPTFAFGIQSANYSSTTPVKIKNPSTHHRCFNPNLLKKPAPKCPQLRAVAVLRGPIAKQTDFSLSLAKHAISTTAKNGTNFVISPASVQVGLGMITAGSISPTRDQLLHYLHSESVAELNSLSSSLATRILADGLPLCGPNLTFANGVWVDRTLPLKPAFKGFFNDDFNVAVKDDVDFRTKANKVREEVNEWAYRKTENTITELIPFGSVNSRTRLLLANALCFRGLWDDDQFDLSVTRNRSFFLENGKSVEVPFMSSWEDQYVRAFDDFRVATLPYRQGFDTGREFSMHIFLPNERDGLALLVERVCSNSGFIEHLLPCERVKIGNFRIPKFKVRTRIDASEILKGHGLDLPFARGGLSKMVDDSAASKDDLCVSRFFNESVIEVDELGSRPGRPSACPPGFGSTPFSEWVDFVADHPFLFVIREEKSGVVLFVGQVLNPVAAA